MRGQNPAFSGLGRPPARFAPLSTASGAKPTYNPNHPTETSAN